MYCSRSAAIKKLKIPSKIFDWICFIKGIPTFCPRRRGKDSIFLSWKNFQKIENDPILSKTKQLVNWKKIKQKTQKISKKFRTNFPTYNFYQVIKKKIPKFKKAIELFKNLLPFFFMGKEILSEAAGSIKIFKEFENIFSKCFYLINTLGNIKKVEEKKETIILEIFFLGQTKKFILPTKKNREVRKNKKFEISAIRFYLHFMGIMFSKLWFFQNFSFLDSAYYFLNTHHKDSLSCPVRFFFKKKKKSLKNYFLFPLYPSQENFIYKEFSQQASSKEELTKWLFSRNFISPSFLNNKKNLALFLENKEILYPLVSNMKGTIVNWKNNENIILFFTLKKKKIFSLICQLTSIYWLYDSVNSNSFLPTYPYSGLKFSYSPQKILLHNSLSSKIFSNKRISISSQKNKVSEKLVSKSSFIWLKKNPNYRKKNLFNSFFFFPGKNKFKFEF